jgi:chloride channel 3/4/5
MRVFIVFTGKNQIDREAEVIYADRVNSVELLRDQLERAVSSGETDGGFPVVREEDSLLKLVGYMGLNELEHALSEGCFCSVWPSDETLSSEIGRAAEHSTGLVHFRSAERSHHLSSSMTPSVFEESIGPDPLDFTVFMDQVGLLN